jgi:ATP-dependent Lon protease
MTVTRERTEARKLPMMPIRDMVIFPYMMTPFVVGREFSVSALEEALNGDRKIFLATQHDASSGRAQGQGDLPGRLDLQHRAERQNA